MKLSEFFRKWKKGIKDAQEDPVSLLQIRISGYIGNIIGTICAIVFLIVFGLWYVTLAFAPSILIQWTQLVEERNKLKAIREMNNTLKQMEEEDKIINGGIN